MISFSLDRIKFTVDFSFFAVIAFLCIIDGGDIILTLMEYYGNEFIKYNAEKIVFFMGIITSLLIFAAAYSHGIINLTLIFTLVYLMII